MVSQQYGVRTEHQSLTEPPVVMSNEAGSQSRALYINQSKGAIMTIIPDVLYTALWRLIVPCKQTSSASLAYYEFSPLRMHGWATT